MGFELSTNSSGGGRRARVRPSMNVTPLVDVVLVLLIIFMVITPMLLKQFWLHVPNKDDESKVEPPIDSRQPVVLTVTPEGRAQINKVDVEDAELSGKLRRIFAARKEHVLFFDASDELPFGRAMEVMDLARGGGAITIVALHEPVQ